MRNQNFISLDSFDLFWWKYSSVAVEEMLRDISGIDSTRVQLRELRVPQLHQNRRDERERQRERETERKRERENKYLILGWRDSLLNIDILRYYY